MAALRGKAGLCLLLALEAVLFGVLLHRVDIAHHNLWLATLTTPVFAAAVWLLARLGLPARQAMLFVLGAGALFQLIALTQQPLTSDDDFRYIWDGKVQLAGVDPYRYAPDDPRLAGLRDHLLFGTPGHCGHPVPGGCTAINRPSVHTVYPPLGQAAFVLVRVASFGGHGGRLPFQLAAALGAVAITWLLCRRALATARPMWLVALWAWCPVTISEFGNNAHIDWLAVLLIVLAVSAASAGRSGLSGLLVGAAAAVKVYPALVLPSLLRRRPLVVLGAAVGLVAVSYLPHVLAVGSDVIGFLPGYLHQEGYATGTRFLLLGAVLPHPLDTLAGVLVLGAIAYWAWRHSDPDAPERTAVVTVGVALLVTTPNYGWYAALLIALATMSGAWEWLPVALAPTFSYLYRGEYLHTGISSRTIYLVAALLTATAFALRRPDSLRRCRHYASTATVRLRSSPSTARR
jgi:hypothetical protein